jgi:hypothetical protein
VLWRSLVLAPAYLAAATLPLLSSAGLNLEYEYALLTAWLTLVLVPLVAALTPYRWLPALEGRYEVRPATEIVWMAFVAPLIVLAPGALLFASKACPCSKPGFAFWMAVLWVPAWVLAHAAYHLILRLRVGGTRRWLAGVGVFAALAVAAVSGASSLWFDPQKRAVNLVLGFLHGPIYDEWIAFDGGILLARGAHLALALALLFTVWWRGRISTAPAAALAYATWIGLGLFAGQFPSVKRGEEALDDLLHAKVEGAGFTLHYRPGKKSEQAADAEGGSPAVPPVAIQRLVRDAEFHMAELQETLGEGARTPVQIYVYPNEDVKKLWFGGGATDVTDVRTPSVHITTSSWPHPTLRHELVHALASGFGYHGLGFHPNLAFTEGLAVALAPEPRSLPLDAGAAALLDSGRLPDVGTLFTPLFWKVSGARAYTVAGSLIRWLVETKGIGGVKALYGGKSWDDAFGASRETLVAEWRERVMKDFDKERNAVYAEALFRSPGILGELCPHSKADLARGRDEGVFVRMRQPAGWDPEQDLQPWLTALAPNAKETRLRGWRKELRTVAGERFPPQGRLETWKETLARARANPPEALEDVELAILESDVARLIGDAEASVQILEALETFGQTKYLGDGLTREVAARLAVERQVAKESRVEWRRYLAGWRRTFPSSAPAATAGEGSEPWILAYLRVRNEKEAPLDVEALGRILAQATPDRQLPATFHVEWYRLIAHRLMKAGAFAEAAAAYDKATEAVTTAGASPDIYAEHARRARYYAKQGPLKAVAAEPAGDQRTH